MNERNAFRLKRFEKLRFLWNKFDSQDQKFCSPQPRHVQFIHCEIEFGQICLPLRDHVNCSQTYLLGEKNLRCRRNVALEWPQSQTRAAKCLRVSREYLKWNIAIPGISLKRRKCTAWPSNIALGREKYSNLRINHFTAFSHLNLQYRSGMRSSVGIKLSSTSCKREHKLEKYTHTHAHTERACLG